MKHPQLNLKMDGKCLVKIVRTIGISLIRWFWLLDQTRYWSNGTILLAVNGSVSVNELYSVTNDVVLTYL